MYAIMIDNYYVVDIGEYSTSIFIAKKFKTEQLAIEFAHTLSTKENWKLVQLRNSPFF